MEKLDTSEEKLLADEEILVGVAVNDPVNRYLNEIRQYKLLDAQEEHDMMISIKNGDQEARKKFINANLRLVVSIARRHVVEYKNLGFFDLIQEGNLGLLTAIERFDPDKGYKFSTYATYWIIQAITRAKGNKNNAIRIPIHKLEAYGRYNRFVRSYEAKYGKSPSDQVIKAECGFNDETLYAMRDLNKYDVSSLNETIGEDGDSERGKFVPVMANGYQEYENALDKKILLLTLKETFDSFSYYIIYNRIFREPPAILEELGKDTGLTRERIRQLEAKALARIKTAIYDIKSEDFSKKKGAIFNKYGIKQIDKMDLIPLSINQKIFLYMAKNKLSDYEYFLIYYLYVKRNIYTLENLQKLLYLEKEDINKSLLDAIKKVSNLLKFKTDEMFLQTKKEMLEKLGVRKIINIDLTPIFRAVNTKEVSIFFNNYSFDKLKENCSDYLNNLDPKQLKLIYSYLNKERKPFSNRDIHNTEREINLHMMGYIKKGIYLPMSLIYKVYMDNKDKFNERQKVYADYALFDTMSKEDFDKTNVPKSVDAINSSKTDLIIKIEKIYFGLDSFREIGLTKEQVEGVLSNSQYIFTDLQRKILKLHYGIEGDKSYSISEIAEEIGEDYIRTHDKIAGAKEKVLKIYYTEAKLSVQINAEKYRKYIDDFQYEITLGTRKILSDYLLNRKSYREISKETGLSQYEVSNVVTDGIRKLDFYRYNILQSLCFTKEELEQFFLHARGDFSEQEKEWINKRFFQGQTSEDIFQATGANKIELNRFFISFMKRMIRYKCTSIVVDDNDYEKEIKQHVSDSILEEQEKKFASFYFGLKSKWNKKGIKYSKSEMMNSFNYTESKYYHVMEDIIFKMRQKKAGFLCSEYGLISREELEKILQDPRLPISDKEKEIIKHLKELDGYQLLPDKILAKKYDMSGNGSLKRRYQRAILSIKKYQAGEIEPEYSYELDIEPLLKYFTIYDQELIKKVYVEKIPVKRLPRYYHTTENIMFIKINRIKLKLSSMINGDKAAKKFDFEYARSVIDNDDFPLYENKEQLIKIYKMYFGENGYTETSSPEIVKQLNLPYGSSTINKAIDLVMISVEKYKIGIRKERGFTYEQVFEYYHENIDHMTKGVREKFEKYFRRVEKGTQLNQRKSYFSNEITFQLLKRYNQLEFSFQKSPIYEAKSILTNETFHLFSGSKDTIKSFYNITDREIMSGKDKMRVLKLLGPVYQRCKKQELDSDKTFTKEIISQ